jgi:uncharacterized protein YycO
MKLTSKLFSFVIVITLLLSTIATPVFAAPVQPEKINLTIDTNGNQVADAIEKEYTLLSDLSPELQAKEIASFVSRLPISPETRKLQDQTAALTAKLKTASASDAVKIIAQISAINKQIEKDPVIAQISQNIETVNGARSVMAPAGGPNLGLLQKGDILGRRSGLFVIWPWAMTYEHTGNYDANSLVYESNSDGVKLRSINEWKTRGSFVGVKRHNRVSASDITRAVNWAKTKYGWTGSTRYNYNFVDKWTDSALYCSQLSWKIGKNANIDLDSNNLGYLLWAGSRYGSWIVPFIISAAAPDEVMASDKLNTITTGWN